MWNKNIDILATGYFLVSREAFRLFRRQSSAAMSSSSHPKTAWRLRPTHLPIALRRLLRSISLVAWPLKVPMRYSRQHRQSRCGSARLQDMERRVARTARGILQDRGGRSRGTLPQAFHAEAERLPEDIAEAIFFLASDASAKSTGNIINVDAGNAQSFTR